MTEASNPDGPQHMDGNEMAQSDFNILYKDQTPLWTPGCPVLFQVVQVSGSPTGTTRFVQTRVMNLSDSVIDEVVYTVTSANTGEVMTFTESELALAPGESKAITARQLSPTMDNKVSAEIDEVKGKGVSWRGDETPIEVPKPKPLHLPAEAKEKRLVLLRKDGLYDGIDPEGKIEDYGNWWVCSCGQLNVSRKYCLRCHRSKDEYLTLEDEAKVEERWQKDQEHEAAVAEDKQRARKKGIRYAIIAGVIVAVIAIGIGVYTGVVMPEMERQAQYDKAMGYLESGKYQAAETAFNQLGVYRDSKEQLAKAQELKAEEDHQKILDKFESILNSNENPIYRYMKIQQLAKSYKDEDPEQVKAYVKQSIEELPEYPYLNFADLSSLSQSDAIEFLEDYGHFIDKGSPVNNLSVADDRLPDGITIWRDSKGQAKITIISMSPSWYVTFKISCPMSYQDAMNILVPLFGLGQIEATQDVTDINENVVGFQAKGSKFADGQVKDWTVSITDNIVESEERTEAYAGNMYVQVDL